MKRRTAWRYLVSHDGGETWYGTCPLWASQPLPQGATLTRERVVVLGGRRIPCTVRGCTDSHVDLAR